MANKFKIQESQYKRPYHHLLDLENHKFYDIISWGLEYYSYVSYVLDYFDKIVKNKKINNVAEVGCGDGKILHELAKKYQNIYFEGYDLSKRAILFAKAFSYELNNIKFFDYDFKYANKKYDVILCIETLEHIPDENIQEFIKTIYYNLKNRGILILTVPTTNLKLHPKHYRHYNIETLKIQIGKLFKIEKIEYIHNFKSIKTKLINFILVNDIFILSNKNLRKGLINYYKKYLRIANKKNGAHLFVVLKKV